jgi:hypothetical protein
MSQVYFDLKKYGKTGKTVPQHTYEGARGEKI